MPTHRYAELRKLSTDALIVEYDRLAANTEPGLAFVREELARRNFDRAQRQMWWMTAAILALTVLNTAFVALAALHLDR